MTLVITTTGLDGEGVTLLPPTAPEFDSVARPLIGERVADLALRLKPMLVVVSNRSEKPIVSFSVVWHVRYPSGQTTRCWGHASFSKAVCGDALTAGERALTAGDDWVHARDVVIHGWGDQDPYYDQFLGQFVDQEETLVANASELRIELNAVIFADGELVGPDDEALLAGLFGVYVGAKQAWYRQIADVRSSCGCRPPRSPSPPSCCSCHGTTFATGLRKRRRTAVRRLHYDDARGRGAMQQSPPPSGFGRPGGGRRPPTRLLAAGLALTIATIAAVGAYTFREIRDLRDRQTAISDRNRKDSLQLLRIQNDLSSAAVLMRDMADRAEPYPMPAWRPAFDRLRTDLSAAVLLERTLAPGDREPAQQTRLESAIDAYWRSLDDVFARAGAGDDQAAMQLLRGTAIRQQRELDAMVSQFLVANTHAQEEAARANRGIYDRVARDLIALVGILIVILTVVGTWIAIQNRRAFEEVRDISDQLRTLSWHTLRLQEDLQRSISRELHDDFGQIVTAIGTLLGRARRHAPADAALAAELDAVLGIAQQTLDRIRTQSQWLHPGVLDDFGLEKALERSVEQFERQTGIRTTLAVEGPVGSVAPQLSIHVYRITQEALNNVARHSGSSEADVRLICANGALSLDIADRGTGLPPTPSMGLGFVSMRERAELMGGRLHLRQAPAGGVTVELRVPDIVGAAAATAGAPA